MLINKVTEVTTVYVVPRPLSWILNPSIGPYLIIAEITNDAHSFSINHLATFSRDIFRQTTSFSIYLKSMNVP